MRFGKTSNGSPLSGPFSDLLVPFAVLLYFVGRPPICIFDMHIWHILFLGDQQVSSSVFPHMMNILLDFGPQIFEASQQICSYGGKTLFGLEVPQLLQFSRASLALPAPGSFFAGACYCWRCCRICHHLQHLTLDIAAGSWRKD